MYAVSLFDYTGNMLIPWRDAGYECIAVDTQYHEDHEMDGIRRLKRDLMYYPEGLPTEGVAFVSCFPPCTHLAISGARWFAGKGLRALAESVQMFATSAEYAEATKARYLIENPMSTISTYWRKPDFRFHPCHYTAFELSDNYQKETWLWVGGGFRMPDPAIATTEHPDDRIHKAAPSPERANFRSATPMGFARAVFEANCEGRA